MADQQKIPLETLLDWVEGRLAPAQADQIAQLVANSGQESDLAWVRAFQAASAKVRLSTPDPELHAALLKQYRPSPFRQALRQIAAWLSFDSATQPALSGVRSAQSHMRQVMFESELLEIALNMRPSRQSDQIDLNGQIFPSQSDWMAGIVVQLARATELVDVVLTNEVGEFQFSALPPGDYALTLLGDDHQVVIERVSLQLAQPQ